MADLWFLTASRHEAVEACHRYLTDHLDITGARWGLHGAEAVLRLRTVVSNGDLDPCWRFHTAREHQRLYPTSDQDEYELMT